MIVEPVQGEGGVRIPAPDYLRELSRLCRANGSLLVVDEVQTGFCRTGPLFATSAAGAEADFLTMAKGIAGGFPLGAFAMTEAVAGRLEAGDHGGTYCGNPLACAVADAVIRLPDRRRHPRARRGAGPRGARAHDLLARALSRRWSPAPAASGCCCWWSSATRRPPAPSPPSVCGAACSCARPRATASACSRR